MDIFAKYTYLPRGMRGWGGWEYICGRSTFVLIVVNFYREGASAIVTSL